MTMQKYTWSQFSGKNPVMTKEYVESERKLCQKFWVHIHLRSFSLLNVVKGSASTATRVYRINALL